MSERTKSPYGPDVEPGQPVYVLEWAGWRSTPSMARVDLVGPIYTGGGYLWVDVGGGNPARASRWRLPTPEELAAFQLAQLQAGGL